MGHFFSLHAILVAQPVWVQEVVNSYVVDPQAQSLFTELAVVSPNTQGYSLSNGLIKKKGRIWLGTNSALHTKIIFAFHDSAIGGHSGIQTTYQRVKKLFVWRGLKQSVEEFIQQCIVCQKAKHKHCSYPGLLQPLPIPSGVWQDISMDFIEGLLVSKDSDVILVVVD